MSDETADRVGETKGRVVVGVDGSEESLRALDLAVCEAVRRGTELETLYAAGWPRRSPVPVTAEDVERIRTAGAELVDAADQRARSREPELRTVPSVHTDSGAAEALVRAGRDAALTVVGARGHGGFTGLLVGSVALRVAAHCQGPVLVAGGSPRPPRERHEPRGQRAHPERGHRERGHRDEDDSAAAAAAPTLVGLTAGGEEDDAALRFGFAEAVRRGSPLRVLHAWTVPRLPGGLRLPEERYAAAREAAAHRVRDAVAPYREGHPEIAVSAEEQGGGPAASLVEASRAAGVLVLAAHRERRPGLGLRLGPVAHAVVHHAHCPVVLVPAG